ncbi:MAG: alpha/beta hydrolase [Mycobacterium sp.]
MAATKHIVLIHGGWSRGEQLAPARAAFEERGYTAHTPTRRHHELPSHDGAMKIASLSLRDYTDDLVAFVNSLDSPPLLVGHSMGGLLAQLVAARTRQAGLVAACPAPAAGIFGITPINLRACLPHLLRHVPGPSRGAPRRSSNFDAGSPTPRPRTSPGRYIRFGLRIRALCLGNAPCGVTAFEGHRCRFRGVTAPVLMMGAECDRIVPSGVVRQTAARYRHGTSVEIPRSDHMVFSGAALPVTMGHIDYWIARNHVLAIA